MLPRNHPDRIRVSFDDHRLVANAGLLLPASARRPWPPTHGGPRSRGSARDPDVEVAPNPACGGPTRTVLRTFRWEVSI